MIVNTVPAPAQIKAQRITSHIADPLVNIVIGSVVAGVIPRVPPDPQHA